MSDEYAASEGAARPPKDAKPKRATRKPAEPAPEPVAGKPARRRKTVPEPADGGAKAPRASRLEAASPAAEAKPVRRTRKAAPEAEAAPVEPKPSRAPRSRKVDLESPPVSASPESARLRLPRRRDEAGETPAPPEQVGRMHTASTGAREDSSPRSTSPGSESPAPQRTARFPERRARPRLPRRRDEAGETPAPPGAEPVAAPVAEGTSGDRFDLRRRRRGGRRRGRGWLGAEAPRPEGATETPAAGERLPESPDGRERPEGAEGGDAYDRRGSRRHRRRGRGRRGPQAPLTPEELAAQEAKHIADAAAKEERRRIAEQQRAEAQRRKAEREAARRAQQQSSQSKRPQRRRAPSFGETWWSARWTAVLETFGWAARVARGAEYARAGAVTEITMDEEGVVVAAVQGSLPEPYRVELSLVHLSAEVWEAVLLEMSRNALLAAQLLAGDMPQDIEDAFFNVGVTLFPYDGQEIYADCDCPDEVNPCKHIAAVFYTLAQEFDRDPFLIFRFRGKSREQVAAYLRALRAEAETVEEEEPAILEPEDKPLADCLDHFWRAGEQLDHLRLQIAPPVTPGAVLMRLGQPNGWDGARGFIFTMAPYYQALSERALAAAFAESGEQKEQAIPI